MTAVDVVVVGAGITGLTAAHDLLRRRPGASVVVLEAADRVGGKLRTTAFAGRPVDWGADAFLARVPEGIELCRELGLADALVSPAVREAYVYARGALRRFPAGLVLGVPTDLDALAASGVVSAAGVARAGEDLTMAGDPWQGDESVGSLVRRRVGDEVFEALVAPLLGGVNAGNADELSVEAGAPQFAAAVRDQPSLITGLRAQAAGGDPAAPVFFGLPTGTQTLTDALAASVTAAGGVIHLDRPAERLARQGTRWRIGTAAGDLDAAAVVLAAPDPVAARLLESVAPSVAEGLAAVAYASVVMIALAVPASAVGRRLDGSGFLVARPEGLVLTACSWASSKWAHLRASGPDDTVVLRASAGRSDDTRALTMPDDELVRVVVADLGRTMELHGPPQEVRVTRWTDALPQFRPGHLHRVAAWRDRLAEDAPGVAIAGAGVGGLGLPACIRQARAAAALVAPSA